MNRRELLLLGINRQTRSVELSCEWLYMKFSDSQLDHSTAELFERLELELKGVDDLRLLDTSWLASQNLKDQLEPLLASIRARGGRVTHSNGSVRSSKSTA